MSIAQHVGGMAGGGSDMQMTKEKQDFKSFLQMTCVAIVGHLLGIPQYQWVLSTHAIHTRCLPLLRKPTRTANKKTIK
jgi:hypothetical protein